MPMRVVLGFGLVMCILAAAFAVEPFRLLLQGEIAEAKVVKVARQKDDDGDEAMHDYTAVITFQAGEAPVSLERFWSLEEGQLCLWPCYYEGETVSVRYLPGSPAVARVDSAIDLFGPPLFFGVLGVVCTFFAFRALRASAGASASPPPEP